MQSNEEITGDFLSQIAPDRRDAIEAVRSTILENLSDGFVESVNWGMLTYNVPLEVEPDTYNGKPLQYAALASQKNHMAVYLSGIYGDDVLREKFEADYRATGLRMDIGKSCVRFRKLEDLPLALIGDAIAAFSVDEFVALTKRVQG